MTSFWCVKGGMVRFISTEKDFTKQQTKHMRKKYDVPLQIWTMPAINRK